MHTKSKVKYSQIRNFLDYRVQNVPENSSKTSLREENFMYFKFLEGQFYKESLPLST